MPSSQQAVASVVIDAPPEVVAEAALDVESYPVWARSVKEVVVVERDGDGRPSLVSFVASALGRRVRYTLRYDYSAMPDCCSWSLVEGDPRAVTGEYSFQGKAEGPTEVGYRLEVDLGIPLPGIVRRRAEHLVLSHALKELKAYVEE